MSEQPDTPSDDPGSAPESGEHDSTSGPQQVVGEPGSMGDDPHYAPESGDLPEAG